MIVHNESLTLDLNPVNQYIFAVICILCIRCWWSPWKTVDDDAAVVQIKVQLHWGIVDDCTEIYAAISTLLYAMHFSAADDKSLEGRAQLSIFEAKPVCCTLPLTWDWDAAIRYLLYALQLRMIEANPVILTHLQVYAAIYHKCCMLCSSTLLQLYAICYMLNANKRDLYVSCCMIFAMQQNLFDVLALHWYEPFGASWIVCMMLNITVIFNWCIPFKKIYDIPKIITALARLTLQRRM